MRVRVNISDGGGRGGGVREEGTHEVVEEVRRLGAPREAARGVVAARREERLVPQKDPRDAPEQDAEPRDVAKERRGPANTNVVVILDVGEHDRNLLGGFLQPRPEAVVILAFQEDGAAAKPNMTNRALNELRATSTSARRPHSRHVRHQVIPARPTASALPSNPSRALPKGWGEELTRKR